MTHAANVSINGRDVLVEWTDEAALALAGRTAPLFVELELYFSCLVKKFVHFREEAQNRETVAVDKNLQLYFRAVTSTACSMEKAEALGRQPEEELHTDAVRKMAPKKVSLDYVKGHWRGSYLL